MSWNWQTPYTQLDMSVPAAYIPPQVRAEAIAHYHALKKELKCIHKDYSHQFRQQFYAKVTYATHMNSLIKAKYKMDGWADQIFKRQAWLGASRDINYSDRSRDRDHDHDYDRGRKRECERERGRRRKASAGHVEPSLAPPNPSPNHDPRENQRRNTPKPHYRPPLDASAQREKNEHDLDGPRSPLHAPIQIRLDGRQPGFKPKPETKVKDKSRRKREGVSPRRELDAMLDSTVNPPNCSPVVHAERLPSPPTSGALNVPNRTQPFGYPTPEASPARGQSQRRREPSVTRRAYDNYQRSPRNSTGHNVEQRTPGRRNSTTAVLGSPSGGYAANHDVRYSSSSSSHHIPLVHHPSLSTRRTAANAGRRQSYDGAGPSAYPRSKMETLDRAPDRSPRSAGPSRRVVGEGGDYQRQSTTVPQNGGLGLNQGRIAGGEFSNIVGSRYPTQSQPWPTAPSSAPPVAVIPPTPTPSVYEPQTSKRASRLSLLYPSLTTFEPTPQTPEPSLADVQLQEAKRPFIWPPLSPTRRTLRPKGRADGYIPEQNAYGMWSTPLTTRHEDYLASPQPRRKRR
ncbi:hypothetical protein AX16_010824 [Volvariella volvacea WC 439]|nr:hypothetical protein AX16_010824 [Volvariella volvacea WC 439]